MNRLRIATSIIATVAWIGSMHPAAATPSNTTYDTAVDVMTIPFTHEVQMTTEAIDPERPQGSCGAPGASAWYRFQIDRFAVVTVSTAGTTFDTTISIYTGQTEASLQEASCNDDVAPGDQSSSLVFETSPGTRFDVQVAGKGDAVGTLQVSFAEGGTVEPVTVHGNDDLVAARDIPSLPFQTATSIVEDTIETGEPIPRCPFDRQRTIWYRYTPTQDGDVLLSTRGNRHDLGFVTVFTGDDVSHLDEVTCVWTWTGATTRVFHASASTTYFIQLGTDADPDANSPMAGFAMSVAPSGDLTPTVSTSAIEGNASAVGQRISITVTNDGDVATGGNDRYLVSVCPATAGSCSNLAEPYFVIGPHQTYRNDLTWYALGWAGDYTVRLRLILNSFVDIDPSNTDVTGPGSVALSGTGVGIGAPVLAPWLDPEAP
jgi:hypothetical protein